VSLPPAPDHDHHPGMRSRARRCAASRTDDHHRTSPSPSWSALTRSGDDPNQCAFGDPVPAPHARRSRNADHRRSVRPWSPVGDVWLHVGRFRVPGQRSPRSRFRRVSRPGQRRPV